MLLPRLPEVSLTRLPPFQDMGQAVRRDVRGLWSGIDALGLHDFPAANEPTFAPELERVMQRGWGPPLGWGSLGGGAPVLAGVGFSQIQGQPHLSPGRRPEPQGEGAATREPKKLTR